MRKDTTILIKQLFKYGIVGVFNTVITLATIFIVTHLLKNPYLANGIGYILGFCNSFIMNRFWTFKSTGSVKKESFTFIIIFGICYLIQLGIFYTLNAKLNLNTNWAQIIAMVFYTVINFLGNKFVTFKDQQ